MLLFFNKKKIGRCVEKHTVAVIKFLLKYLAVKPFTIFAKSEKLHLRSLTQFLENDFVCCSRKPSFILQNVIRKTSNIVVPVSIYSMKHNKNS